MNTMDDMKNINKRREDRMSLAKSVADGLVLGALLIVLCIVSFALTPYMGG